MSVFIEYAKKLLDANLYKMYHNVTLRDMRKNITEE